MVVSVAWASVYPKPIVKLNRDLGIELADPVLTINLREVAHQKASRCVFIVVGL
jgi:hypothetical protein